MPHLRHILFFHNDIVKVVIIPVQKGFKNRLLLLLLMKMKGDRVWHTEKGIEDLLRAVTE